MMFAFSWTPVFYLPVEELKGSLLAVSETLSFLSENSTGLTFTTGFYVLACLVLPIVWGVAVHRAFELLQKWFKRPQSPNDPKFPDFQI